MVHAPNQGASNHPNATQTGTTGGLGPLGGLGLDRYFVPPPACAVSRCKTDVRIRCRRLIPEEPGWICLPPLDEVSISSRSSAWDVLQPIRRSGRMAPRPSPGADIGFSDHVPGATPVDVM